jgi:hypothetical protein
MAGKRQHIIPQLHLRHFAGHNPKGHVWTYDATAEEPRSATPENTAVETHFYSVEMENGTMNPLIDDYITDVEGKAAPIYRDIIQGKIPGEDQEKVDFSTFLAVMYFRTTAMRRMFAELYARQIQIQAYATATHDGAFETYIDRYEKAKGREISAEEKEIIRKGMLNPGEHVNLVVPKEHTLIAMQGVDELRDIFFRMKWSVGEAEHEFFITSDNPVMRRINRDTYHPVYGDHGFLNKTAQVTFPLSPKRLLVLTWENSINQIFPIPREYVYDENQGRAAHSDRCLYSHIRHKNLMEMAHRFKDSRPDMTTSGFGPKNFAEVRVPRKWKK